MHTIIPGYSGPTQMRLWKLRALSELACVTTLRRRVMCCAMQVHHMAVSQAIVLDNESGFLIGGSDPRKDGCALGW